MATSYESFAQTFKAALIQLHPKPLDPEHNFNAAANYIRDAAEQGASLAVLPEYHLTGWYPEDSQFAILAQTAYQYVSKYQELASELKINIAPGTIVTVDPHSPPPGASNGTTSSAKSPSLLNIAPFISYTGELLGSYTKANLWLPERNVLTSGPNHQPVSSEGPPTTPSNPHSVIETPLGPVGIVICWDLAFPEAFRALVRQGARLIIIPTYWTRDDLTPEARRYGPDVDIMFLKNALVTRAFENTCAILFCNVGGPAEEGYAGLSRAVLPLVGPVEGGFDDGTPGMRIVEVDMKTVDIAEENYKIREDLASDSWHYGYSHDK
ncbi:carbon-nitrogen hydrolase [Exophiala viscosa]|uniref:Carbon-nitrogen hydrolase n=1 Tax=Exophiala viscosa TaxID=2486360 RepID=A0AAN6E704_9EURO|nr:carbon-nitrogen hydrolase [Exophiala viscosa]KAI1627759.1 carbon-nitrogen hydrolase [Exophiala viscosa]